MLSNATYNAAMLTLARESRGLTQTDLSKKSGIPQSTISKMESGALCITVEFLEPLARILNYPLSFFEQRDQVYPFGSSTFYHRKHHDVPASILRKVQAKVNIYRMHVLKLLRATDLSARNRFKRFDIEEHGDRIDEIAGLVRASWRLPSGPIGNLTRAIEDAGGIVVRFDFETTKMFGLSEWILPAPPIFFLNANPEISADRDRFTLAHELGHVILHDLPNPLMENQADRFAAEFLMPESEIRPYLISPVKLATAARLKPIWKVSMAAIMHRAKELGIINENQYTYLRIQLQQKGYRLREPKELDIPREQPSLLGEIIQAHVQDLGYDVNELADMVCMSTSEFRVYHEKREQSGPRLVAR